MSRPRYPKEIVPLKYTEKPYQPPVESIKIMGMSLSKKYLRWILSVLLLIVILFFLFKYSRQHVQSVHIDNEKFVVILDPNYPLPEDPGANLFYDTRAVELNWEIATKVQKMLAGEKDLQAVLTRQNIDDVIANDARAKFANRANAALFVHIDANVGAGKGYTVFTPETLVLRQGDESKDFQRKALTQSSYVSNLLHQELKHKIGTIMQDNGVKPLKERAYHLDTSPLNYSEVPSVLVEVTTLSHQWDALYVNGELGKTRIAEALANAIKKFYSEVEAKS